jgi:taurine dioxygenase
VTPALEVAQLRPFGVEVDLDLSQPLDDSTRAALRSLLWEQHLLRFRHQDLSLDGQIDLMASFGPVNRDHGDINARDYVTKDPELGGNLGSGRLAFHNDLSASPLPMIALSLYALDVEPETTSTRFIDSAQVYRELPAALRDRLDGLEALHAYYPATDTSFKQFGRVRSTSPGGEPIDTERNAHATHPLVLPHPHTGEPILFVNELLTDRVLGLSDVDSEALMTVLLEHTYQVEHIYEHWWEIGDLVVWDNLAVQHGRRDQAAVPRRTLRRVVCAEKSIYEQHPQFHYEDGKAVLGEYA